MTPLYPEHRQTRSRICPGPSRMPDSSTGAQRGLAAGRRTVFGEKPAGHPAAPSGPGHRHRRGLAACRVSLQRLAGWRRAAAMRVLIRADASPAIGSGHVARCLTLAQVLRSGGAEVVFACRALPGHSLARIAEQGFRALALPCRVRGRGGRRRHRGAVALAGGYRGPGCLPARRAGLRLDCRRSLWPRSRLANRCSPVDAADCSDR